MSISNRPKIRNAPCSLINSADNEILFRLLGPGCSTLASAVVQLFLSDSKGQNKWNKRYCGVACFVKDNSERSYFIRIFDIKKQQFLWEQELYTQFRYKTPREFFHTFETESCQAGLNFASEDEAIAFKNAVETKLTERHERKRQRTMRRKTEFVGGANASKTGNLPIAPIPEASPAAAPVEKIRKNSSKKGKKGAPVKRTKADISTPTDFRHLSHVGWDPDKGFDMDNLQPDMKMLFTSVGIKPDDKVDKETIDFIYDFVGKNGGIEAVRKEMERKPPPPPPPTASVPRPPARTPSQSRPPPGRSAAPSPPPSRRQAPPTPSRVPPKGQAPPPPGRPGPPGPPTRGPAASLPRVSPAPVSSRPSPPQIGRAPPPPPMAGGPPPPPPPPPPPDLHAMSASSSPPSAPSSEGRSSGGRGALLQDLLKGGSHLKKIEPSAEKPQAQEDNEGLVGALARALVERQKHIQGSDDEDDDDFIDDDEWDD